MTEPLAIHFEWVEERVNGPRAKVPKFEYALFVGDVDEPLAVVTPKPKTWETDINLPYRPNRLFKTPELAKAFCEEVIRLHIEQLLRAPT